MIKLCHIGDLKAHFCLDPGGDHKIEDFRAMCQTPCCFYDSVNIIKDSQTSEIGSILPSDACKMASCKCCKMWRSKDSLTSCKFTYHLLLHNGASMLEALNADNMVCGALPTHTESLLGFIFLSLRFNDVIMPVCAVDQLSFNLLRSSDLVPAKGDHANSSLSQRHVFLGQKEMPK